MFRRSNQSNLNDRATIRIRLDSSIGPLARKIKLLVDKIYATAEAKISALGNFRRIMNIPELDRYDYLFVVQNKFPESTIDGEAILWGALCLIIFAETSFNGAMTVVVKRAPRLQERLHIIGLRQRHYEQNRLFDMAITFGLTNLFLLWAYLLFPRPFPVGTLIFMLYFSGVAGMTIGYFFGGLMDIAGYTALSQLNFCALALSGSIWPQDALTGLLYYLSQLLPHTHVVAAVQSVVFQAELHDNAKVFRGFWVPMLWAVILYPLYLYLIRRQKRAI